MNSLGQDISKSRHPEGDPLPMTGLQITRGRNLLSLFALDSDSPILIMGKRLCAWKVLFPKAQYCETMQAIPGEPARYDLVLMDGSAVRSPGKLGHILFQIKQRMSGQGVLILFARNRFSFRRLKDLFSNGAISQENLLYSHNQIIQIVENASFPYYYEYLPFSQDETTQNFDEMVEPDSRFLEIPYYQHPIIRLAHALGKYYLLHDRYAIICMHKALLQNSLFEEVRTVLAERIGADRMHLQLERFDIRYRGTLVLFIKDVSTSKYFIARLTSDIESKSIVKRNHSFLKWLQQIDGLPDSLKAKIPMPLAEFDFLKNHVFIETLIPGILAWKINKQRTRSRIFEDSTLFIFELSIATGKRVSLDQKTLDELFLEDKQIINGSKTCTPHFKKLFNEKISCIKRAVEGQDMWLSASHGDYGYGNIITDPRNGRLNGVIDWDTGRKREFVGVDIINLMIQKHRVRQGEDFYQLIKKLDLQFCNELSSNMSDFMDQFNLDCHRLRLLLSVAIIRYISRSAQFTAFFESEKNAYSKILELIN